MKILFLGSIDRGKILSGASKVANEVFARVKDKYPQTFFISYYQDGKAYTRWQKLFGKSKFTENFALHGIFPLLSFIIKNKPKIIQIIFPSAYYIPALFLSRILGVQIQYLVHQNFKFFLEQNSHFSWYEKKRILVIEKLSIIMSNKILVLSELEKQILINQGISKEKELHIIDNGINIIDCKKKYFSSNDKQINIVTVGSLKRVEKGYPFLIQLLEATQFEINLTICSSEEQKEFSGKFPSNVKVTFKMPLDEIGLRKELIKHDIFIAVSKYEPFNISLLEAMNSGVLYIGTDRVGLTERFNLELLKFVIPYGDVDIGVEKISEIINLTNHEKQILSEKLIYFSNQFSWDNVINQYYKIYDEIFLSFDI